MTPNIGEVALGPVARQMPESLKTLQHIYLAEQVWLARVRGNPLELSPATGFGI
jgi:uncharacterized damage-inducible protein DinB